MTYKHIKLGFNAMSVAQLCDAYRSLDERRIEIDKQMMTQAKDEVAREQLWAELETTLARLDDVIDRLTRLPAARLPDLRAKAIVVAALMRGTGPQVTEVRRADLALSLTEDISDFSLRKRGS